MSALALLVVDVQQDAVGPGLYAGDVVLDNIARLVAECHVQHEGDPVGPFEPGTEGWRIHHAVRAEPNEKVVRKRSNSSFPEVVAMDETLARQQSRASWCRGRWKFEAGTRPVA